MFSKLAVEHCWQLGTASARPYFNCLIFFLHFFFQYSDISETERAVILEKFRQATMEWNQNINTHPGDNDEIEDSVQKSNMIVVTDACVSFVASGEQPILARVLINFELSTKKVRYIQILIIFTPQVNKLWVVRQMLILIRTI